jgi:hypothetical protein
MHYRSDREGLPPAEKARQDRLLWRCIALGITAYQIGKRYGFTEVRVKLVADAHGLTLAERRKNRSRANG